MRRFPVAAAIGGILFAWLVLVLMAFHQPKIYDLRIFGWATLAGVVFALVARYMASHMAPLEPSTPRAIGCGCSYAFAGLIFFCAIGGIAAGFTNTTFSLNTVPSILICFATLGGLGLFGGYQFARLRQAEMERQRAALERQQLEVARDLQQRLLPPPHFDSERFRIVAKNVPAAYVAGDFYDFVPIANDRLLIVIADVAGKGVAAGLIVATVKAIIPLIAVNAESPDEILRAVNGRIAPQLSRREFVAMVVAIYDTITGDLSIANAGIPDPLLVRRDSVTPIVVDGARYPVGVRPSIDYRNASVRVEPGERVVFFTDGVAEANIDGEPLGYRRVADVALKARGDVETIFMAVEAMSSGAPHDDDWTAVALERL